MTVRTAEHAAIVFEGNSKSRADAQEVSGFPGEAYAIPGMNTAKDHRFLTMAILSDSH